MLHIGLPVVASRLGGLEEIYIHNENVLFVETEPDKTNAYGIAPNSTQLADFMHHILTDDELRKQFSQNAKKRANCMFTADIMINNYLQTVKNLN